jgi:threonine dehydrogenase-like Zn-dependent dehydrogenase
VILKGLRRIEPLLAIRPAPRKYAVLGAGPLGHICARILVHRGHRVTAFDRNPKRLAYFDGTEISTAQSFDGLNKFDAIVEITGDPDVLDAALHTSRANVAILLLGLPYGEKSFSFEAIAAHDKTVIGSVGSTAADFEAAIVLLPMLELDHHLACRMRLEDFEEAWRIARKAEALKVILDVA